MTIDLEIDGYYESTARRPGWSRASSALREVASEPALLGASPQLLAVARRGPAG